MLNHLKDMTVCVVLDAHTLPQFQLTWQTWLKFYPELFECPWVIMRDEDESMFAVHEECRRLHDHLRKAKLTTWQPCASYGSQRERMLSCWVHCPPVHVETKRFLKIDADSVCLQRDKHWGGDWFSGEEVVVAPGCGRTVAKPRGQNLVEWFHRLETFGDEHWRAFPRLNLPIEQGSRSVRHRRWKSWLSSYDTKWYGEMSDRIQQSCGTHRLPVPSQDSTLAYCTIRGQYPVRTVSQYGWTNVPRLEKLRQQVAEVM